MSDTQIVTMLMTAAVSVIIISIVMYVIMAVAYWQIFKKAGEKGWKALIPVYNSYIMYKISWKTSMFWLTILLGVVYGVIYSIAAATEIAALSVLAYLVYIAVIVIGVIAVHKMSKAFGHGVGFTIGLILLSPIFILILAFGKSQYVGKSDGAAQVTSGDAE